MTAKKYRLGVVAVFQDTDKQLLVGKRTGIQAWQFPQGGIDGEEEPQDALFREMREEIGCKAFEVIKQASSLISYDFPPDLNTKLAREYQGQAHFWFLCRFIEGQGPNLQLAEDEEFEALSWFGPQEVLARIISWKKPAYEQGLKALGLLAEEKQIGVF